MNALLDNLQSRLAALKSQLLQGLIEREEAISLALLAALSGEHLLLVGVPGTGKSFVARRLQLAVQQASYFERLLTRFSVPEELFGPLSIRGLEQDRYERLTAHYLPTASIAFLDEIFKANSAILNALLTLLNEREFDNGTQREKVPLISVIGASNELPEGEELNALFDRFLFRLDVQPVSKAGFSQLLQLGANDVPQIDAGLGFTADEIASIQEHAQQVSLTDDVIKLLSELRMWCVAEYIQVSDRRWRKLVKLLQIAALTNGRNTVSIWDCYLLQHCLWELPEQRQLIADWYESYVGSRLVVNIAHLQEVVSVLEEELEQGEQLCDDKGNLLYIGLDGQPTTHATANAPIFRGQERLYLRPGNFSDSQSHPVSSWPSSYAGFFGNISATVSGAVSNKDRTNNGQGYTEKELDLMRLSDGTSFKKWKDRDWYLNNHFNWLFDEATRLELQPLMSKKAQSLTARKQLEIQSHLEQIALVKYSLQQRLIDLQDDMVNHLWLEIHFIATAEQTLLHSLEQIKELEQRLQALYENGSPSESGLEDKKLRDKLVHTEVATSLQLANELKSNQVPKTLGDLIKAQMK